MLARIVGDKLQAKWGQPVIIENRSGGSGNIGAALVAQAEPDGYTLLVSATPPLATNQSLYKELSYKPEEFVPITNFGSVPNLVIVRKGLPVNSLIELIAYAKANPLSSALTADEILDWKKSGIAEGVIEAAISSAGAKR